MTQINPFTGSVLQAPLVQRQQAAEKDRQIRRAQDARKDAALSGEHHEHQVESSDGVAAIHDEDSRDPQKRKPAPGQARRNHDDPADDGAHLDLTA